MGVTAYSLVMGLLWFTIAAWIGSMILPKVPKGALVIVAAIFFLAFFRMLVPLDFSWSIILHSKRVYPFLQKLSRQKLLGWLTVGQYLLVLWCCGAVIRLIGLTRRLVLQQAFCRSAVPVEDGSQPAVAAEQVRAELGCHGKIRIGVCAKATSAYQAGFFHPNVLLPGEMTRFSDEDIRNMLRHELSHFVCGDLWIKLGMQVITCVLWWNPVMAPLNRSVEQLLELRCDRRVCEKLSEEEQIAYGQTLLNLMRFDSVQNSEMVVGFEGDWDNRNIQQRFHMMCDERQVKGRMLKTVSGILVCLALFVASYCIIIQPFHAPPVGEINGQEIAVDTSTTIIMRFANGELKLVEDGKFIRTLSESDLTEEPYCFYEVVEISN